MFIYGAGRVWNLGDGYTLADGMLLGQLVYDPAFEPPAMPLLRETVDSVRQPTFSMFIEGIGDVTADIKRANWHNIIRDTLEEPNISRGTVTLVDTNGALIQNGRCMININAKIKIWAGFGETRVPRFTGNIRDPKISANDRTITLGVVGFGYTMKNAQTSGDFADFNTPHALVNELLRRACLGTAEFENEEGLPTTYTFTDTDLERRDFWSLIHGATLAIGYIYYFDENGKLQFRRRDGFTDIDVCLDDSMLMKPGIVHQRMAKMINSKSVSHAPKYPSWTRFTLSDGVRFGQKTMTKTDLVSKTLYGERANQEAEELIGVDWDHVFTFVIETVDWYKDPRHVYAVTIAARPQLQLMCRLRIRSEISNVKGYFTVIGIQETVSPGNYWQRLTLLSERETN